MEAELDVTTPMSEQNVSMVTKGSDTVRCVCEVEEENDFMIQVKLTETHVSHRRTFNTTLFCCFLFFTCFFHCIIICEVTMSCPFPSVMNVCAGSMAPAWASLSTMCLTLIAATFAETHQVITPQYSIRSPMGFRSLTVYMNVYLACSLSPETEPALLVRQGLAEQWSHVWPVFPG